MKCEIPGRIPWVFPFIGHRDDVGVEEMAPLMVSCLAPLRRWWWKIRIAVEPGSHLVVVVLFGPQHSRQCLPHDVPGIIGKILRNDAGVKLIGLSNAFGEDPIEALTERPASRCCHLLRLRAAALALRVGGSQAQIDAHGLSWPQRERIMSRGFRSNIRRIHSSGIVLDDGIVDTILDIR